MSFHFLDDPLASRIILPSLITGTSQGADPGSTIIVSLPPKLWQCSYCGSLQNDKRLSCSQCGAPRQKDELP